MTTTLSAEVPPRLMEEIQALVDAGWFSSRDELVVDALRRFIDSHSGELTGSFIREDIEWGLRGAD
jgi:Arc/MetJ-type ribon-helix-helix transcriptional regulator